MAFQFVLRSVKMSFYFGDSSKKVEEQNFILEFIEVYRSLPALWQIDCKEYSKRNEKNVQYKILLKKYKEKYPNAEKKDVAQKINSLRTAYRKELRRIERLEESGAGADDELLPRLYYFDAIDFLRDNLQPCAAEAAMDIKKGTVSNDEAKKRKKTDSAEELMTLAAKRLKHPPDDYEKLVESWVFKLRKMNASQVVYADKFINEILFEGQMGTLHRNSMQLNTSNPSTLPQSHDHNTPGTQFPVPLISPQVQIFPNVVKILGKRRRNRQTNF